MVHFELTNPLMMEQLKQAKSIKGVKRVEPLIIGSTRWDPPRGEISSVRIMGFDPSGVLFKPGEVAQGNLKELEKPYQIMLDESRLESMNVRLNEIAKIRSLPVQVVGLTKNSQSIVSSTFAFTSVENASAYLNTGFSSRVDCKLGSGKGMSCRTVYEKANSQDKNEESLPPKPEALNLATPITYVLVQAEPGQDLEILKKELEKALPGTKAHTKAEMIQINTDYWQKRTSIGSILGLGAVVGVIVGMVVVGQILYSSVADHIKEFGTLKAMGVSDKFIYGVIVEQALWMAILGYIPAMIICGGLSRWMATQGVAILITPLSVGGVFGITLIMCVGSAFFAIQKVTRIDPAIVFKS
ncbi:MAG: FtsX-like permease family protein [Okeania sp. SIO2D1]|nr:FtsX-like permease family protein [Okeania sp. SIO2D1]